MTYERDTRLRGPGIDTCPPAAQIHYLCVPRSGHTSERVPNLTSNVAHRGPHLVVMETYIKSLCGLSIALIIP